MLKAYNDDADLLLDEYGLFVHNKEHDYFIMTYKL